MNDKPDPKIQSLKELFANLDAVYGLHTRLYKLNYAVYDTTLWNLRVAKNISSGNLLNVKGTKINNVRTTSTIILGLLAVISVAIQVLPFNVYTVPISIIVILIIYVFFLGIISYKDASKSEEEFEKIIEETELIEDNIINTIDEAENICSGIESWIDYTNDQIHHFQTLGRIAKEILKIPTINTVIRQNYEEQLKICIKKLNDFKQSNEKNYKDGGRTEKEYEMIELKINYALEELQG